MAKIILINPFLDPPFTLTKDKYTIPLGPLYVGSYLKQNGHDVKVIDANNYDNPDRIFRFIKKEMNKTLCIGISAMTAQLPNALKICKYIKNLDSSIPIIFGGVHSTLHPKQTIENEYIDYAVIKEGEESFLNLIKSIESGKNPKNINGIAFKKGRDYFITKSSSKLIDLNKLSVDYNLLNIVKKMGIKKIAKFIDIPYQTSRGCPHRCSFCINTVTKNRIYRYRKPDLVLDDVERLVESGVKNIFFMDENFFANPKRVKEIVQVIKDRKIEFRWFGNIRADYFRKNYIDHSLLKQIKGSGCTRVSIGTESGSQKILDMIKKDIKIADVLRSAKMLNKVGINCNYSFMIGLPEETFEDMKKTILLISKIKKIIPKCRFLGPQIYRPYPGSELYKKCLSYGLTEPDSLEGWAKKIENDLKTTHPEDYPWLKVPMDIIDCFTFYSLIGFSNLSNNIKYKPLKIIQKIARLRCENSFFEFPIEKKIFNIIIGKRTPI